MKLLHPALAIAFAWLLSVTAAFAQAWPPASVRIIVPYPPGTEPDILARDIANALSARTGKSFVVESKPGANSIIGTDLVAKGEGDGSILLMVDRLAVVTNPMLYSKMPYRWEESLKPVTDVAGVSLQLGVRNGFPAKTFEEFINYAKANPGKVNVGTGGQGHVNHIGSEMIAQAYGLKFSYVPYKGVAPAVMDLIAGQVDMVLAGGLALADQAKAGKLNVLVHGDSVRAPHSPNVPTLQEAGGRPGIIPATVFAMFAPAKVPDAMLAQISSQIGEVLANPELRARYAARALVVKASRPSESLDQMKTEAARYEKIIREAGIKIE